MTNKLVRHLMIHTLHIIGDDGMSHLLMDQSIHSTHRI